MDILNFSIPAIALELIAAVFLIIAFFTGFFKRSLGVILNIVFFAVFFCIGYYAFHQMLIDLINVNLYESFILPAIQGNGVVDLGSTNSLVDAVGVFYLEACKYAGLLTDAQGLYDLLPTVQSIPYQFVSTLSIFIILTGASVLASIVSTIVGIFLKIFIKTKLFKHSLTAGVINVVFYIGTIVVWTYVGNQAIGTIINLTGILNSVSINLDTISNSLISLKESVETIQNSTLIADEYKSQFDIYIKLVDSYNSSVASYLSMFNDIAAQITEVNTGLSGMLESDGFMDAIMSINLGLINGVYMGESRPLDETTRLFIQAINNKLQGVIDDYTSLLTDYFEPLVGEAAQTVKMFGL